MIEWSNDDEDIVPPPLSVQTASHSTRVEEQPRGSDEVPEQQATKIPAEQATRVPEQQVEVNPVLRVEETPEQQAEQRPTVEEDRPPPESTGVDPTATPRGLNRPRRFKKYTGRPNGKYPRVGVVLLFDLSFLGDGPNVLMQHKAHGGSEITRPD